MTCTANYNAQQVDCEAFFPPAGTEYIGNYNESVSGQGGFTVGLIRPQDGDNSTLTNGFESCSQGQLLFDWLADGQTNSSFDVWLDVVDPRDNGSISLVTTTFASAQASGMVTPIGAPVTLTNVQVPLFFAPQTVTRFRLRIVGTPDEYCGSLLLNYDVINGASGANPARFTSSRLWYCPTGQGCNNIADAQQVWDFETVPSSNKPPSAFSVSTAPVISGGVITSANIPGTEVLLLGDVVYNGNTWVNDSRSRIFMGPGATLSFGNDNSPAQNITVTNASFFPCADQAFNTISVGSNSTVTMVNDPTVIGAGTINSIIYGANTGVTVQPGGNFTADGISIDGCFAGVSTNRAASLNLNNVQISYEGLQPNGSRYAIDPDDGGFVGVDISGADLTFGQAHILNNVAIQNQQIGVMIGGSGGFLDVPYRQARVAINGGAIVDVNDGVLNGFNRNGILTTTGLNIDAINNGIVTQRSFGSVISLSGGTINADQIGVELSTSGNTFMLAQNMNINDTEQFGMRAFQSPNSSINFTGNTITIPANAPSLATAASVNGNVNGQTIISGNTITTLAEDALGVSAVGNQNNGSGFRQSVAVNNNDVAVGGTASTGINIEDNSRGNIGCNQVSNLIGGNGPAIAGAVGMTANTNDRISYNCNYLGEVEYGLAIVGVNENARNQRFAFHCNDWGLTVGFDVGPLSSTFDEIGENMNFPAFEYQGFIPNDTYHFAHPSMYDINRVTARDGDPLFTPTSGDFANWFDLVPNNNPASDCGNCLGVPPVWPIDDDCPPSIEVMQSEWTNLYKTRLVEKGISDYPDDCTIPTTCYTPLAQTEATFEGLISNDYFNFEAADQLGLLTEDSADNGLSTEELSQLMSLSETLNTQGIDETNLTNSLSKLRNSLADIPSCSEEGVIWKESLDLSIKALLPEGLSKEEMQLLASTAMECSTVKGPGVYLARRTLGLASNDAKACIVGNDTENLVIRSDKTDAEFEVFPSPARAGSLISTKTDITSEVVLTSASNATMVTLTRAGDRSFKLPTHLVSGMFIISYQSGDEVITTKLQVIE